MLVVSEVRAISQSRMREPQTMFDVFASLGKPCTDIDAPELRKARIRQGGIEATVLAWSRWGKLGSLRPVAKKRHQ